MKKRIILGFLLFFCAVLGFGEEEAIKLRWFAFHTYDDSFIIQRKNIYEFEGVGQPEKIYTFLKTDLVVDSQGWVRLGVKIPLFNYHMTGVIANPFVIMGGKYIVFFESEIDTLYADSLVWGCVNITSRICTIDEIRNFEPNPKFYEDSHYIPTELYGFGVKEITATSHLTEIIGNERVEYISKDMNYILEEERYITWIRKRPWVEGVAGSGIGESLTITFKSPEKEMLVLNGYVDPYQRYLYKANNRLRVATIESLDLVDNFKFDYTFEDIVQFSEISFPENTAKVKLTIKEVYRGEKWDDTAISAVVFNNYDFDE